MTTSQNAVNIRRSHPNLYRSVVVFAGIYTALGVNFIFSALGLTFVFPDLGINFRFTPPAFNPYQIPYWIVGAMFLSLGLSKIVFLRIVRDVSWLRRIMAAEVTLSLWWGIGASFTFFDGRTSLQLPILYAGLAFLEVFQIMEPATNPMTGTDGPELP